MILHLMCLILHFDLSWHICIWANKCHPVPICGKNVDCFGLRQQQKFTFHSVRVWNECGLWLTGDQSRVYICIRPEVSWDRLQLACDPEQDKQSIEWMDCKWTVESWRAHWDKVHSTTAWVEIQTPNAHAVLNSQAPWSPTLKQLTALH